MSIASIAATEAEPAQAASWASRLDLEFTRREGAAPATVCRARHEGALRVLAALYPEDPRVCHQVLVHPPGGLVGGDTLELNLQLQPHTHGLLTTPGATRYYRSAGPEAVQHVRARVGAGARLEWLPLEALAFDGCRAQSRNVFDLDPGAEMLGWDMLALGLPAARQPLQRGQVVQHLELPGVWLERGCIGADDDALLQGASGLDGATALGTLWFASGQALEPARAEALLEHARAQLPPLSGREGLRAGVTQPNPQVLVLRVLAQRIEPVQALLQHVWGAWRMQAWGLAPCAPRVWRT